MCVDLCMQNDKSVFGFDTLHTWHDLVQLQMSEHHTTFRSVSDVNNWFSSLTFTPAERTVASTNLFSEEKEPFPSELELVSALRYPLGFLFLDFVSAKPVWFWKTNLCLLSPSGLFNLLLIESRFCHQTHVYCRQPGCSSRLKLLLGSEVRDPFLSCNGQSGCSLHVALVLVRSLGDPLCHVHTYVCRVDRSSNASQRVLWLGQSLISHKICCLHAAPCSREMFQQSCHNKTLNECIGGSPPTWKYVCVVTRFPSFWLHLLVFICLKRLEPFKLCTCPFILPSFRVLWRHPVQWVSTFWSFAHEACFSRKNQLHEASGDLRRNRNTATETQWPKCKSVTKMQISKLKK